jgi:hypothetical protein
VPSTVHNVIVELIEAHPDVLEYLLTLHGLSLSGPLVPAPDTLAKTVAVERRVDRVFLIGPRDNPESFLLTEVQLDADDRKRFAWALYMELSRSRHGCEGGLLILTVSEGVRRWIRDVIMPATGAHGTSRQLTPTVVALDAIAPERLLRRDMPYLAQLAVAAHAGAPDAREVAEQAVDLTIEGLPERLAAEQLDAILGMVDSALRAQLERRVMERHEYRSELFRGIYEKGAAEGKAEGKAEGEAKGKAEGEAKGKAEGEAKGKAEGKAESILTVLAGRHIPVSRAIREQIRGCTDLKTLDLWLRRALTVRTAASVVSDGSPARPRAKRAARATAKRPAPKRAAAKK